MEQHPPHELHVLLTHLHLDHLQGLGFFRPLFTPGLNINVWGPASPVQRLAERIAIYLSPPLFPVHLNDVPSNLIFHDAPEEEISIGSAKVRAGKVQHQGPTVGYRIEEHGRTFVYLPDHEPSLGNELSLSPPEWMSGHDIAHGADLLFHDAQYRDDEYARHVGWGHSRIADVIEFVRKSDVKRVVLFHHDPYRTDEGLEELLVEALSQTAGAEKPVSLAYEGMTFLLDGNTVEQID